MVHFIVGEAGTGKTFFLRNKLQELTEQNKKTIALIPEQHSFVYETALYNKLGAELFHKTECFSFRSLSRDIFRKYGYGKISREYADDAAKMIILERSIKKVNESIVFYKKKAQNENFLNGIMKLIKRLLNAGIAPEDFSDAIVSSDKVLAEKSMDIYNIYSEYLKEMHEAGKKDSDTDVSEAAAIAARNGYFNGVTVFIDEFDDFTDEQYKMAEKMIDLCDDVWFSFRSDNIFNNKSSIFKGAGKSFSRLREYAKGITECDINSEFDASHAYRYEKSQAYDIENLSRYIFRNININKKIKNSENIKIFEADDMYGEAEYICSEIKKIITESNNKIKYSDIAVLTENLNEYSISLEPAFKRYDIPYNLSLKKSVYSMPLMQYMTSLFNFLSKRKLRTEDILRIAHSGLTDANENDILSLEEYVYIWNIDGETWEKEFTVEKNIEAESARKAIIEPLIKLRNDLKREDTVINYCTAIINFLDTENIDIKLQEKYSEKDDKTAESCEFVWNKFMGILSSFVDTAGDDKITLKEFADLILTVSKTITFDMPPLMLNSVEIADASMARLDDVKVVFIIGVNDGVFPEFTHERILFTESEQEKLSELFSENTKNINTKRILPDIETLSSSAKLAVYKAISAPSEKLYLTYPLSGSDGEALYKSEIIMQCEDIIENFEDILTRQKDTDITEYAWTEKALYRHYVQDRRNNNIYSVSAEKVLKQIPEYSEKIEYLENMQITPDYNIHDKSLLRHVNGERLNLSPSALEIYSKCPFSYFFSNILKIRKPIRKEFNPLSRGNITHEILQKVLEENEKNNFINLSSEELKNITKKIGTEFLKEQMASGENLDDRMKAMFERTCEDVVNVLLHLQKELKQSKFIPVKFELKISDDSEQKPKEIKLKNGCSISVNGKIDRADVFEMSDEKIAVRIIDYKTGNKEFKLEDLEDGYNYQMLIYLFTITDENGIFENFVPAGIFYMPASDINPVERNKNYDIEKIENDSYKMDGIVLQDTDVINAMDSGITGNFIKVNVLKSGVLSSKSKTMTEKQFKMLKNFIIFRIKKTGDNIYDGKFATRIRPEGQSVHCEYCDYADICGNSDYNLKDPEENFKFDKKASSFEDKKEAFFENVQTEMEEDNNDNKEKEDKN